MIQLRSISMSRFRGVREGSIQGLTDVNLFIGRNNSGKTTVAEAITRLAFWSSGSGTDLLGRSVQNLWTQARNESQEYPPELWYRQDQTQVIVLEGHLGEKGGPPEKDAILTVHVKAQQMNVNTKPREEFEEGGTTKAQVTPFVQGITLFRPQDILNRNIETQNWPKLLANRRDKALTRTLNEVFDLQAEGFQLLPDHRLMVLFEEHSLPLDVQGDGTRAAMRALIVLTLLKGTLLILEEPECHQHPGSLERCARALCKQAREQEVQLLVSTQSAECVRAFLSAAKAAESEAATFHLTLDQGRQTARCLDSEAVEMLQSTGVDVRFLDLYA